MSTVTFIIITMFYGFLNIIASIIGLVKNTTSVWSSLIMLVGGILTLLSSITHIKNYNLPFLIVGLLLFIISALFNGIKMYGKVNFSHHFIRFLISFSILLLYFIKP